MEGKGVGGQSPVSTHSGHGPVSDADSAQSVQTTKWGRVSVVRDVEPLIPRGWKAFTPKALYNRLYIAVLGKEKFITSQLPDKGSKAVTELLQKRAPDIETLDRLAARLTPEQVGNPAVQKAFHNHYIALKVESSPLADVSFDLAGTPLKQLEKDINNIVSLSWDGAGDVKGGAPENRWLGAISEDIEGGSLASVLVSDQPAVKGAQESLLQFRLRYEEARLLREELQNLRESSKEVAGSSSIEQSILKLESIMQYTRLMLDREEKQYYQLAKESYLTQEDHDLLRDQTPERTASHPAVERREVADNSQSVKEFHITSEAARKSLTPDVPEKTEEYEKQDLTEKSDEQVTLTGEAETKPPVESKRSKPGIFAPRHVKAAHKLLNENRISDSEMTVVETMFQNIEKEGATSNQFAQMLNEFPEFQAKGVDIYKFLGVCVLAARELKAEHNPTIIQALNDGLDDFDADL